MDVVPASLLTIFDFQELELLLCGLPTIDIEDWMDNTLYSGSFRSQKDQVCQWFWEVVHEFQQEKKARLLQFVTGTSGVPAKGFACLQGNEGGIKKFTIHGVSLEICFYPRAQ
jgi:E3 ubiquitin-protein ligase NEDD4